MASSDSLPGSDGAHVVSPAPSPAPLVPNRRPRLQHRSRSWPLTVRSEWLVSPKTLSSSQTAPSWLGGYAERTWDLVLHDVVTVYLLVHRPLYRLKTLHIHAICHLLLLMVASTYCLYFLQGVLVPVLLAAGAMVLLEPIVFVIVDPWVRCFRPRPAMHGFFDESMGCMGIELAPSPSVRSPTNREISPRNPTSTEKVCGEESSTAAMFRTMWCVVAVCAAIGGFLILTGLFGFWVVSNVASVDWLKYLHGERIRLIRESLAKLGVKDFEEAVHDAVIMVVQAVGLKFIGSTMSFLTGLLLMLLFLGFFLMDAAVERSTGKEPWRPLQRRLLGHLRERLPSDESQESDPKHSKSTESVLTIVDDFLPMAATLMGRLRLQMRVYIRKKFYLSVFKAVLIGGLLACLDVDLWVVWTLLTFFMNFMPLGSAISTFAPMPFVALDPNKSLVVVAVCFLWPLLVHNFVGNVVEPKIFAQSLNLHPITVLMALTFWTALWGILGALVCVPLTAMTRVSLAEASDHPYSPPLVALMEGRLPTGAAQSSMASALMATWQSRMSQSNSRTRRCRPIVRKQE